MSRSEPEPVRGSGRGHHEHPVPPWWYWAFIAVFAVVLAGMPLWGSFGYRRAAGVAEAALVLVALALGVVGLRRRARGELHLPRVRDFPSAFRCWVATLLAAVVPAVAIPVTMRHGHRFVALIWLVVLAVLVVAGLLLVRAAMRADIRAGRVRRIPRRVMPGDLPNARFATGDRVVWAVALGMTGHGTPFVYSGTFVADGPAPWVSVRHDGAPDDARVKPAHLFPESDYMALVESHGAPPPTTWG